MKKAIYNNKLRYLAIALVCVFAVIAAAEYGVTVLSWWWNNKQNDDYAKSRLEIINDKTLRIIDDAKAIVLNKDDGAFYYETDMGFVPVEELLVRGVTDNSGTEDLIYSLNTSGGKLRYVRDSDKSQVLDVRKLNGVLAVGLKTGDYFLLNDKLIKKNGLEKNYVTGYVYYARSLDSADMISEDEYFERREPSGADSAKQTVPMSDEELLYRYIDVITSGSRIDLPIAVAATIVGLLLAVYVVAGAGHFGSEEIVLTAFDRCGLFLLFVALSSIAAVCTAPLILTYTLYGFGSPWVLLGFAGFAIVMCVLCAGWFIESVAVRFKAHRFLSTTTVYYIITGIRKPIAEAQNKARAERMAYREETNGLVKIMDETAMIVSGELDEVSTEGVIERYHPLVDSINAIAQGKSNAVSDKLNSDRMRTELITNVSHDIKTPLTSIISYVELLEKEGTDSESAAGYVDVLKRQSLRLKNLLEDLIEASKASTGVLQVNKEELRLGVIVNQVLAEYDERLAAKNLSVVTKIPEDEKYILTDGRHLSRVIGNLLSNITKYSLEGTRVYIDVDYNEVISGAKASITFKNTSASQLNISSGELMERFVRGDESRKTDGSGLGLSIAGSLMKLLGGDLDIAIDGDLFKATVIL